MSCNVTGTSHGYTYFGRTSLRVSTICYGTWQFGGDWSQVDQPQWDAGKATVHKALEAEVFIIASADRVMRRPNAELMVEMFPAVPMKEGVGTNKTLLSIAKAQRVLGYQPQYSWRDQREEG